MKKFIGSIICLFLGHKYKVEGTFLRIGGNQYHKIYECSRCGKIKHRIVTNINP